MTSTGYDAFDKTVQETNLWLKKVMESMQTDNRHIAYMALKAVLHALRDRIGPEDSVHLAAQLPMLLRGMFYKGWQLSGTPTKERRKEEFLAHVRVGLPSNANIDAEDATRAVFGVMWEKVDPDEVSKTIRMFPKAMRDLWPITLEEEVA